MIKYSLTPNRLTSHKNDYMAQTFISRSYNMDDILEDMLELGTSLSMGDAELALSTFEESLIRILQSGGSINTPLFHIYPSISGVFEGADDRFDETRHRVNLNLNPGVKLRQVEERLKTEKTNGALPIPKINGVVDTLSGSSNKKLTPGGVMTLIGSRLKLLVEDEANGIFLIATNGDTPTKCPVLVENKPSRLIAMIPSDLASGTYTLEVRSTWTTAKPAKTPRIGRFRGTLTV